MINKMGLPAPVADKVFVDVSKVIPVASSTGSKYTEPLVVAYNM